MVNYTPKLEPTQSSIDQQTNLTAKDFMLTSSLTVPIDMNVVEALHLICEHNVSGVPVVDKDQKILGYLSGKDCLKYVLDMKYYNESPGIVGDYMAKSLITLKPTDTLMYTVELFIKNHFQTYPVVDDGILVGTVTRAQVMDQIRKMGQTSW
ncbi:CBS domain-containing protein [Halobacteriovorax sp. GB3]|uniref:CBS domain-containing protein n=1 Tax=Halobacteriovorax sp. GB3 TaxID=2719615 RepID=UPI00235FC276|nr:CBS domain-containing protein [Halobacteriovorax sp. GB3]MDD0853598.1 CBS domain-containing protein [Halobacteriovorax sp. GB3]